MLYIVIDIGMDIIMAEDSTGTEYLRDSSRKNENK